MQVTSLLRYSNVCPFLGHSTPSSLRSLATTTSYNVSSLTSTAMRCPMMGPNLAAIAQVRAYASVANPIDVAAIHKVCLIMFIISRSDLKLDRSKMIFRSTQAAMHRENVHTQMLLVRPLHWLNGKPRNSNQSSQDSRRMSVARSITYLSMSRSWKRNTRTSRLLPIIS